MAGRLVAKGQTQVPSWWRSVHQKLEHKAKLFKRMNLSKGREHVDSIVEVNCDAMPAELEEQFRLLAVMAKGVPATQSMLANLWDMVRTCAGWVFLHHVVPCFRTLGTLDTYV